MMPRKETRLDLTRRIIAYYLMFGLASMIWLALGIVFAARAVHESQTEDECIARLGEAAREMRTTKVRSDASLQDLVQRFHTKWSLAYCAVANSDGLFVAHSTASQIGARRMVPTGEVACWGETQRTRFIAEDSRTLREYQVPVHCGAGTNNTLLLAVVDHGGWQPVIIAADYAPVVFLAPMLFVALGATVMRGAVRPIARIESQLQRLARQPMSAANEMLPVTATDPASVGWNHLLDACSRNSPRDSLDQRLGLALESHRHNKLDQILNSLPDGIAVTDDHDRITFANRALLGLLGRAGPEDAVLGRTMEECLALTTAGQPATPLLDPAQRGRMVVVEIGRAGDMSRGVIRVARIPQCAGHAEQSPSHVWSVRDITQQKLADQMREQFVNAATHELRTPLTNIKAYAETLALSESMDVEQQKSFCNTINEEVGRLSRFVDDLLYLSRMEVGSTPITPKITSIERMLREAAAKVRPQMDQKKIVLDDDLPAKLPELVLDKDKITVAMVNLLGNAAKYTPEGGRVRLHVEAKERVLQIDVEDSGIGISVADLPKVLEKFFRSSDPRVQEQTGSGLGLSLANEIVRLHGGKLTVQSELNKGSRFTIMLPMVFEKGKCSNA
jgi:PAS domain S-box-containing protein